MIRDYQGLNLSDEEYERVRPEPDRELAAVEKLRDLDLSKIMSARLLHTHEEGRS
jgi:hypothetical protein